MQRPATPPPNTAERREAARARLREGKPQSADIADLGTREAVGVREFRQRPEQVAQGLERAKAELARKDKKPDLNVVAGKYLDENAFKGMPVEEAVEDALNRAGVAADAPKREEWAGKLALRHKIRRKGKAENAEEGKVARHIINQEKVLGDDKVWRNQGNIRDEIKNPVSEGALARLKPAAQVPFRDMRQRPESVDRREADARGENGRNLNRRQKAMVALERDALDHRQENGTMPQARLNEDRVAEVAENAIQAGWGNDGVAALRREKAKAQDKYDNRYDEVVDEFKDMFRIRAANEVQPGQERRAAEIAQNDRDENNNVRARPRSDMRLDERDAMREALGQNPGDRLNPAGGGAPAAGERAGDRAAGPRYARMHRDPAARDALLDELQKGDIPESKKERLQNEKGVKVGINAHYMHKAKLIVDGKEQTVFVKQIQGDGVQEAAGWEMAKAMGLDGILPAAVFRDDQNGVVMEAVGDAPAWDYGVYSPAEVKKAMERQLVEDFPDASKQEIDAKAEDWLEKLAFFDAVIGNNDRHGQNFRVNVKDGKPQGIFLIDQGFMFKGFKEATIDGKRKLVFKGKGHMGAFHPKDIRDAARRGKAGKLKLTPEMRQMLERLDDNFYQQHAALFRKMDARGSVSAYVAKMRKAHRQYLSDGYIPFV